MENEEIMDNATKITYHESRRRPFYKNRRKFKRKFHVEVKYFYDGEDKERFLPEYKTSPSAGCDIRNAGPDLVLKPGDFVPLVPSGIGIKIPLGFEAQVRPRSGLGSQGLMITNTPGTIDADYRGEVKVNLYLVPTAVLKADENGKVPKTLTIKHGERFAQLVFAPVKHGRFHEVEEFSEDKFNNERGENGYGSTGYN